MQPTWNPKVGKGANKLDKFAKQAAARQQKGAGKKSADAKGDRKGGGKGTGKTGKSIVKLGQTVTVANKKVKTARSVGNQVFCSYFNQKGCTKGTDCIYQHACNVLTSPNSVCGKKHPASKHVGATEASA